MIEGFYFQNSNLHFEKQENYIIHIAISNPFSQECYTGVNVSSAQ